MLWRVKGIDAESIDWCGTYFDVMRVSELETEVVRFQKFWMSNDLLEKIFPQGFALEEQQTDR